MNGLLTSLTRPRTWRHVHSHALIWRALLDFRSRSNTRDFPAAAERRAERHNNKAMGEMSGFENRLQAYSSTQLLELLEDDDKLRGMVGEMDEVGLIPEHDWVSADRQTERESRSVTAARAFVLCVILLRSGTEIFHLWLQRCWFVGECCWLKECLDGENECQTEWRQCELTI